MVPDVRLAYGFNTNTTFHANCCFGNGLVCLLEVVVGFINFGKCVLALVEFIVAKFQSKKTNPNGAQIVFTTHNTELLDMELLRKDQLYFVDKNGEGVSELYGISDFSAHTTVNIRKGYLIGKYGATPNIEIEEL